MTRITTHVLDTSQGKPAAGIRVRLDRVEKSGSEEIARAETDSEGRVRDWVQTPLAAGRYRIVFETGLWFRASGRETLYPEIVIHIQVSDSEAHYHVPLLLAPFGYSTYRGS